jgi:AbrB family looped-hinge helix DNA binding protein
VAVIQIHKKGQMTLPREIRARLDLQEGDLLKIEVQQDTILLRRKKHADASQAYFWTDAWQSGEQQAAQDIAAGRTQRFPDASAAVAYLQAEAARQQKR